MKLYQYLTAVICFALSLTCYGQSDYPKFAKPGHWIVPIEYNAKAKPDEGQSSSAYYLLIDEQENILTQENYYHTAYTILTAAGIQEMSDLSFDFDPTYQQLTFHECKIIRNGIAIDKLTKDMKVIQREQSMDRFLYDGTKTAVINLKDIRVGDIVEYAITRKGYNPVYAGYVSRTFYFDFYQSIDKYFKSFIAPANKVMTVKYAGACPQPKIEKDNNVVSYTWNIGRTNPRIDDTHTPGWYDNNNYVMLSEFESWEKVGQWAKGLFVLSNAEREQVKNIAATFKEKETPALILEIIHFVQDEVRYLGFENGVNSHKPYAPTKVHEQRFGDCKDKSFLLASLLQARGIESHPVLVNTTLKQEIDNRLPSLNLFDHCVVQINFNNKKYYIDPTISNQGGTLDNYYFPDYLRGLVIDNDITALHTLPEPISPTTTEEQTFELLTIGGEAMLTVRTTYTGSAADYQRSEFSSNTLEIIKKNYKEYYANQYPDITPWEEMSFTDNRADNLFKVIEKYKIPTFWKPVENEENKIYSEVHQQSIAHYFNVPKSVQQRTSPYQLSYPVDFYHNIHIQLPEDWSASPADEIIENEFYQYEYQASKKDREISLITHYKTKKDHIPADKIETYASDHHKMYNNLTYQLTYNKAMAAASGNTLSGVIVTIIIIVAGVFTMFTLFHRYNPKSQLYRTHGTPIGGWLVLLALGISFTPLRLLYEMFTNPELISGTGWITWFSAKRYGLFAFALFSHIYNILKLLFSALLILLFFQRRTSFPRLMTIQLALNLIVVVTDTILTRTIVDDPSSISMKDAIQAFFIAVIWIPYLNISYRVKETFVIRLDTGEEEGEETMQEQMEVESTLRG